MRRGLRLAALICAAAGCMLAIGTPAGAAAPALKAESVTVSSTPSATASSTAIQIDLDFSWDGVRNCANERSGSVICISAQATVPGLGLVEYARDAVPNGQHTPDGCPEFSTHGQLWVPGGTAEFDGVPDPTCGADDNPDAHYTYTIIAGTGVLAGATGTGDVVADNGVDRWHGTIQLAAATGSPSVVKSPAQAVKSLAQAVRPPAKATNSPTLAVVLAVVIGALAIVGVVGFFVVRIRRRSAAS